jgi:hypothetical protein
MAIDLTPNIDVVEEGVEVECGIGCFSPFEVFDPCIITYTIKPIFASFLQNVWVYGCSNP